MEQSKGLKRNIIDKYYTKDIIVEKCIDLIKNNIIISKDDLIIEPSSGNGAFIHLIKTISNNYKFYDLEPENDEIIQQDYLEFDYKNLQKEYKKIHIVGNPPFGRQSSLAIKFIKKSCEFCDSISFILPKSFKKESMKSKFPLNFHLVCEWDIPDNSFLVNNVEYTVPCVFQLWEKKTECRIKIEKVEPIHFRFVNKTDHPNISFRRVGVNAGVISRDILNKSEQSHYFITFTNNKSIDENIEQLKKTIFTHDNTVGPRSISIQELIKEFNKYL